MCQTKKRRPYGNHTLEDRLEIAEGQMRVPTRPSNGYTLRAQARDWTVANATFGEIDGP